VMRGGGGGGEGVVHNGNKDMLLKASLEEQHMMEGKTQKPMAQNDIQLEENIKGNQEML